ncbi:MAG: GNAT family N-acetyltransferase [Nocardioides sp.]|uniref:GNAT family N-acetyltransferase n=1 Tax=Nocardioides sp. TaxID=35761 RepID=UPI00239D940B|nr:GNAT family N-acetyltransferase [Nocardioides sp.]MDE0776310.1 GNAT family N-acetyltransferase [Nocardioides sp.]
MSPVGVLLAAGAGSRMGMPKALVHDPDGTPWLVRSVAVLRDSGCDEVVVVLGARAEEAVALVPAGVRVVVADDWAEGMSASLRAALGTVDEDPSDGEVAVVTLVDLPDVGPEVVRRVVAAATGPAALVRASYGGRPGHPVVLGRDHWAPIAADVSGDEGAKSYLRRHGCASVECGDLATGADQDEPTGAAPGGVVLETERLRLRPWRVSEAHVQRELWAERDPRVPARRRFDADGHPTLAEMEEWIASSPPPGPTGLLAVELRYDGDVIGYCGLTEGSSPEVPELAYELLRRTWGHGYATEAATAVLAWARASGFTRLTATVWEWNVASLGVLTKLGFVEESREVDPVHGVNVVTSRRL